MRKYTLLKDLFLKDPDIGVIKIKAGSEIDAEKKEDSFIIKKNNLIFCIPEECIIPDSTGIF